MILPKWEGFFYPFKLWIKGCVYIIDTIHNPKIKKMKTKQALRSVLIGSILLMATAAFTDASAQARKKLDRIEDRRDRREDVRDKREDVRDRREDRRDRREDVRDRRHNGGVKDRLEDVRDRREDVRDRKEDIRDRREDKRDRREDRRDRRH